LDQRGQAYSTFKLLIAAIVAMAMLAILIPIIMQAMGWLTNSPLNETKSLISDLVGSPGAVKHTPEVAFKPDEVLPASALVERLPISADQICMSTGQFEADEQNGFSCIICSGRDEPCTACNGGDEPQRLRHNGNATTAVKIAVVCDNSLNELEEDIDAYGLEYPQGNSIKEACQICKGKDKCCAIVLKKS